MIENSLKSQPQFKNLCKAFADMNKPEDIANLLRDLCTRSEIIAMQERLEAAQLIEAGMSYRDINKETGTSTATITRVAQWLRHGCGGYVKALKVLK